MRGGGVGGRGKGKGIHYFFFRLLVILPHDLAKFSSNLPVPSPSLVNLLFIDHITALPTHSPFHPPVPELTTRTQNLNNLLHSIHAYSHFLSVYKKDNSNVSTSIRQYLSFINTLNKVISIHYLTKLFSSAFEIRLPIFPTPQFVNKPKSSSPPLQLLNPYTFPPSYLTNQTIPTIHCHHFPSYQPSTQPTHPP